MESYIENAEKFLNSIDAVIEVEYAKTDFYSDDKEEATRDVYNVTIKRDGKQFSYRILQNPSEKDEDLTAYDILSRLQKYEPEIDIWEFAKRRGYIINSSKSYNDLCKIYRNVCRQWRGVNKLFGDVLIQLRKDFTTKRNKMIINQRKGKQ